jgi:hypothetical protein
MHPEGRATSIAKSFSRGLHTYVLTFSLCSSTVSAKGEDRPGKATARS